MVTCWGDSNLAQATRNILAKVNAVLPQNQKNTLNGTSLFSMSFRNTDKEKAYMATLRHTIREQQKTHITYADAKNGLSHRLIRPLCLSFFAPNWIVSVNFSSQSTPSKMNPEGPSTTSWPCLSRNLTQD